MSPPREPVPRLILRKLCVAQALGGHVWTVERMISAGEIPPPDLRLRGRLARRTSTIEAWVRDGCPRAAGGAS